MRKRLTVAAAAIVAASSAFAAELPTRKPGLWQLTTAQEGRNTPPHSIMHCTDEATDKMLIAMGSALTANLCQSQDTRQEGSTYVIDAVCKMGPMSISSRSVISGDFQRAYSIRTTSKVGGVPAQLQAMAGGTSVTEARWIGACKDGQQPGDIIMPDGKTMNIMNLKDMIGGGKR